MDIDAKPLGENSIGLERLKILFVLYRQYTESLAEVARIEERRAKWKK
jgi:hypothetical protein